MKNIVTTVGKNFSEADAAALALSRTDSQRLSALTGKSRTIARAALNAVGDEFSNAFKLLVSDIALTVVDGLPCEIEPLAAGVSAWLGGAGEVKSIGAFSECSVLRIEENRQSSLQLFTLEPVDVCLLVRTSTPVEPGWVELEYAELPEVDGIQSQGLIMQTCVFDPGIVVVPVHLSLLPPFVRVVGKRAVAPPRNSVLPGSRAAPQSESLNASISDVRERNTCSAIADRAETVGDEQSSAPCHMNIEAESDNQVKIPSGASRYRHIDSIGKGAFGTVSLAEDLVGDCQVAVKFIRQNIAHAVREVSILGMIQQHPCMVSILDSFESCGEDRKTTMSIVMEYLPENLHQRVSGKPLDISSLRCFSFQLLRALAYLDSVLVCHRDLKPENVLLQERLLKLADFGSAKVLGTGPSSNYICSRWWRAPELVLGTPEYSTRIDWWSCGCVIGEMMVGRPLFMGQSSLGQMYNIMQALGAPSPEDIKAMHPRKGLGRIAEQLMKLSKLERDARPWSKLLPAYANMPEILELPQQLLKYKPSSRSHPAKILCCSFFTTLPEDGESTGRLPESIFNFTGNELYPLSDSSRDSLLQFRTRYIKQQEIRSAMPPVEVDDVVQVLVTVDLEQPVAKRRCLQGSIPVSIRSDSEDLT